jgi:hypothetical protein
MEILAHVLVIAIVALSAAKVALVIGQQIVKKVRTHRFLSDYSA